MNRIEIDGLNGFEISKEKKSEVIQNKHANHHLINYYHLIKIELEKRFHKYSSYFIRDFKIVSTRKHSKNLTRLDFGFYNLIQLENQIDRIPEPNEIENIVCSEVFKTKKLIRKGLEIEIQEGKEIELILENNYRRSQREIEFENLLF